jgi:DNA-binding HxlR family transcriptional regulator
MIVSDDKFKEAILASLGDKEAMKIIDAVLARPKSMTEISRETKISHTTVFRKTKWMLDNGLLIVEKMNITPDGKKTSLFRSLWRSILARYEFGSMQVELQQNINQAEVITGRMFSIDSISENKNP